MACQKDASLSGQTEVNLSKIENFKSLTGEAQKLSYNLLNSKEKFTVWDYHFQDLLDQGHFTNKQIDLILELKKINSESIHNTTASKEVRIAIEKEWLSKAQIEFSKEAIISIAYSQKSSTITPNDLPPLKKCNCNLTSAFSCDQFSSCAQTICEESTVGCGFLMFWDCNGRCTIYV